MLLAFEVRTHESNAIKWHPVLPKLSMVLGSAGTNNFSSMKQNPLLQLLMWDANITFLFIESPSITYMTKCTSACTRHKTDQSTCAELGKDTVAYLAMRIYTLA